MKCESAQAREPLMESASSLPHAPVPSPPRNLAETGLRSAFVVDLLLKHLFVGGQLTLAELAERCRLPALVIEPLLAFMRNERLCQVTGRGDSDLHVSYQLTEHGRERAADVQAKNQYVGPAPVTHAQYVAQVQAQSVRGMGVVRETLSEVFADVAASPAVVHSLGAALNSGRAIFLYGPSGAGKSYLAEKLAEALLGEVFVPHALIVEGEVIRLFDPLVHVPIKAPGAAAAPRLERSAAHDGRWVLCRRPVVQVGAELTLRMLDLDFDPATRFYQAPAQVKANNGLLIVDDLGRQLVSARDLMNRWVLPLDRRHDYLALHTGSKFSLPFDAVVAFSSNLRPADLADDAFLRRLGYKIYVGALDESLYTLVVRQACDRLGVPFSLPGLEALLNCHRLSGRPLLACIPGDIIGQVRDRAIYEGHPPRLTAQTLRRAWDNYFAEERS